MSISNILGSEKHREYVTKRSIESHPRQLSLADGD